MQNEPRADVRDMYLAHAMFRREFGAIPDLLRSVASGDTSRATVIADHMRLLENVLEHHHHAEDAHLWPRLLERAGEAAVRVVDVMDRQHDTLDQSLVSIEKDLAAWERTAGDEEATALVDTVQFMRQLLDEHLASEEGDALPLVEQHITAPEWAAMLADSSADIPPQEQALIFGMMIHDADPAVIAAIVAGMPPELRANIESAARQAYTAHVNALKVGGAKG